MHLILTRVAKKKNCQSKAIHFQNRIYKENLLESLRGTYKPFVWELFEILFGNVETFE